MANSWITGSSVENQEPKGISIAAKSFAAERRSWRNSGLCQWPLQSVVLIKDTKVSGNGQWDFEYYDEENH